MFFDFVTHYGGSNQSTVLLIRELQRLTSVIVVDAYGACEEYLDQLRSQGTRVEIVDPDAGRVTIGGGGRVARGWALVASVPGMLRLIRRLGERIQRIGPAAIWVNSQKALFCLARATGLRIPTAIYVRGELDRVRWYVRRDWQRLAAVMANSARGVARLQKQTGFPPVHVIPNGIDVDDVIRRSREDPGPLPGANGGLRLAMAASLIPLKNHAMAIRAVAEYVHSGGDARLWICGDVPKGAAPGFAEGLRRLPAALRIADRVHFLGWRDNVPAVLARSDAVLLTSNTEGMPRSLMEAMALGKPVIATRVGGVPELVRDGVDGVLVEAGDVNGVSEAIARLSDSAQRVEMGRLAQERITEEFTVQRQAEEFSRLLDGLPKWWLPSTETVTLSTQQAVSMPGATKKDGFS